VKVRLIASLREFDALAGVWADLVRTSGQASPFLSHDWFACCWRTAGPDRRRELWLIEDDAAPLAFIPLTLTRTDIRGLPVRRLGILDSPDTPLFDAVSTGHADEIVETFLRFLRSRRDWDLLSLEKIPVHSPTLKALETGLGAGFWWRPTGVLASPFLDIRGMWEEFFRRKTQRFRKTCRNLENRIQRGRTVALEEHRHVDPDGPVFAEMLEVSLQSWKGPRGLAMATMERMPRFFRELTRRASANGWLRLWILRLDGRPVATEYQLAENGCIHALRADFDSTLGDLSPGACLNLAIVRSLFHHGSVCEYDMGPGVNEYKLRWATGVHESTGVDVYAPTIYGQLLRTIETRLVPLARRWRP
jgi:CelD/BcsL family acetyltransferase involved in cellulose biosynthesis